MKKKIAMKTNKETIFRRTLRTADARLQVREAAEGEAPSTGRRITGYAVLFGVPSAPLWEDEDGCAREVIAPGAITRELLDACDIKFTLFHDNRLILARSVNGAGTLSYEVDDTGVRFEFDAPATVDGDKALELVRRGDLCGCSFAFTTRYRDSEFVERRPGKNEVTYTVKRVLGVYDFTLAADPAYPDTSVEAEERELIGLLRRGEGEETPAPDREKIEAQVREMRRAAEIKIY